MMNDTHALMTNSVIRYSRASLLTHLPTVEDDDSSNIHPSLPFPVP
jgi:hypothetical protein